MSPADEAAIAEGCTFDLAAAERVKKFFSSFLRHSKGQWAGQAFALQPWQWEDVIKPLFGWKRADGSRRFRRAYIEVAKKNGKSTLASGIGLYLLVGDGEPGAEVYSVAADRDQANIVHGEAIRMVRASPGLTSRLEINRTTHNISFPKTNSWYRSLSSEANTKEGLNAHGLIVDELHAWKGRGLWDALRYAGRSRRQPLLFAITTAGDDMDSICREQHDYAKAVLAGQVIDTRFFAYIRCAAAIAEGDREDDDWTQPEVWHKANPSLGVTIDEAEFARDVDEAKQSPTTQASFKRYSLNIWSTSTNPWLRSEDWQACTEPFTRESLAGKRCYAGLDLSKTRDMTALVLVFRDDDTYRLLPFFWLPEESVNNPDAPEQFRVWSRQHILETTPGGVCDYAFVKKRIAELSEEFDFEELAYDPYNAEQITQEIEQEMGIKRILFPQTINHFAEPTAEFERLVLSQRLRHNGHPVLAWQAGHVQVKTDVNNNKRPVKAAPHDPKKVDGIVAAVMGIARAMQWDGSTPAVEVWT